MSDRNTGRTDGERLAGLEVSVSSLAVSAERTQRSIETIAESISKLAVIEERDRATRLAMKEQEEKHDDLEERTRDLERHMPGLIEIRGFILKAIVGVAAIVGTAGVALVLK